MSFSQTLKGRKHKIFIFFLGRKTFYLNFYLRLIPNRDIGCHITDLANLGKKQMNREEERKRSWMQTKKFRIIFLSKKLKKVKGSFWKDVLHFSMIFLKTSKKFSLECFWIKNDFPETTKRKYSHRDVLDVSNLNESCLPLRSRLLVGSSSPSEQDNVSDALAIFCEEAIFIISLFYLSRTTSQMLFQFL